MKLITVLAILWILMPPTAMARCICNSTAELTIQLDTQYYETSWKLEPTDDKSCGNYSLGIDADQYRSSGPYTHTLDKLCNGLSYTFTIADTNGDGICCVNGVGSYNLVLFDDEHDDDMEVVASGGEFGSKESTSFTVPGSPTPYPSSLPTPYPSSHPTPSATCVDDSSWYKDDSTAKDCVWVGKKKNKRCSKRSNSANGMIPASSACKASCNTCFTPTTFPTIMPTPCGDSDSTTWHKWGNPNKDCDWAAKRPNKRCSVGSMKLDDGAYGNFAKEECRAACCDY